MHKSGKLAKGKKSGTIPKGLRGSTAEDRPNVQPPQQNSPVTDEAQKHQVPDPTRLQMEACGRPHLFDELMAGINSLEVQALEMELQGFDELPADIRSYIFEEQMDEPVLQQDLRRFFVNGIRKLRTGELPKPHELSMIAHPCYSLHTLAGALEGVKVAMDIEPKWAERIDEMIEHFKAAEKRLAWPGAYGVAQWLGNLACGERWHPFSPIPGPA